MAGNILKKGTPQYRDSSDPLTLAVDPDGFGLPGSGFVIICTEPDPSITTQKSEQTLDFDFLLFCNFFFTFHV
jgi:hypothetical protein